MKQSLVPAYLAISPGFELSSIKKKELFFFSHHKTIDKYITSYATIAVHFVSRRFDISIAFSFVAILRYVKQKIAPKIKKGKKLKYTTVGVDK